MTEYFYDLLPIAVEIGMPLKEFWEEDPNLFWAYRFSYYKKKLHERELENQKAWLQGAYIFEAVSVALNNAFSKSKLNYREEPYDLYNSESKSQQEKRISQQKLTEERLKARAMKIAGLLEGGK